MKHSPRYASLHTNGHIQLPADRPLLLHAGAEKASSRVWRKEASSRQENPTPHSGNSGTKNKPQNAESMETEDDEEKSSEVALLQRARDGRERDRSLVKRCLSLSPHPGRSLNMHDSLGERERERTRDPSQQKTHSTLQSTFCYKKKTPTYSLVEPINLQNLHCP